MKKFLAVALIAASFAACNEGDKKVEETGSDTTTVVTPVTPDTTQIVTDTTVTTTTTTMEAKDTTKK